MTARATRLTLLGAAVALLAATLASLFWGPGQHSDALPAPSAVHQSDPPREVTQAKSGPAPLAASAPARLIIPAIGVDAPVTSVGLDKNHALELPPLSEHNLACWYDQSPRPGEAGLAIIAGHVDSTTGVSVFYKLRYLEPGDKIIIKGASGQAATFTVQWLQQAAKDSFPSQAVYGSVPYPALRLITCGGAFDSATGHYEENVIAYAKIA